MTGHPTRTLTCAITFHLSQFGQKHALANGFDASTPQTRTVEITTDDLPWVEVSADGSLAAMLFTYRPDTWGQLLRDPLALDAYPSDETLLDLCRAMAADKAAIKASIKADAAAKAEQQAAEQRALQAKRSAVAAAFFANPAARGSFAIGGNVWIEDGTDTRLEFPQTDEVYQEAARRQAADEEAARQREALRQEEIAKFLDEYADTNVLARYRAGVLDAKELIETVSDVIFQVLDSGYPHYRRLTPEDVLHDEACYTAAEPTFHRSPPSTLTAAQWERLQVITALTPQGASVEYRRHVGLCKACGATVERFGVFIKLEWNGLTLRREYEG